MSKKEGKYPERKTKEYKDRRTSKRPNSVGIDPVNRLDERSLLRKVQLNIKRWDRHKNIQVSEFRQHCQLCRNGSCEVSVDESVGKEREREGR